MCCCIMLWYLSPNPITKIQEKKEPITDQLGNHMIGCMVYVAVGVRIAVLIMTLIVEIVGYSVWQQYKYKSEYRTEITSNEVVVR